MRIRRSLTTLATLSVLLAASDGTLAQEPPVATAPPPSLDEECYRLCEVSFRAILDPAARDRVRECEIVRNCFLRVIDDPGLVLLLPAIRTGPLFQMFNGISGAPY